MWAVAIAAFIGVGTWTGSAWMGVAASAVAYLVAVQFYPWTGCWWCGESPKRRDRSGRNWHGCIWCDGKGRRLRLLAWKRWTG